jgi:hypothetical protein
LESITALSKESAWLVKLESAGQSQCDGCERRSVVQEAKDPVEVRAKNVYFIAPGNDAAREHLRKLLNAFPQDHKHDDIPLPEKPVFRYVRQHSSFTWVDLVDLLLSFQQR